jgi:hypothetical protein
MVISLYPSESLGPRNGETAGELSAALVIGSCGCTEPKQKDQVRFAYKIIQYHMRSAVKPVSLSLPEVLKKDGVDVVLKIFGMTTLAISKVEYKV